MNPQDIQAMIDTMENMKSQMAVVKERTEQEVVNVQVTFTFDGVAVNGNMPKPTANAIAQWVQMFN